MYSFRLKIPIVFIVIYCDLFLLIFGNMEEIRAFCPNITISFTSAGAILASILGLKKLTTLPRLLFNSATRPKQLFRSRSAANEQCNGHTIVTTHW